MTRKAERKRRVLGWAAIVAIGGGAALVAWRIVPDGGASAIALFALALAIGHRRMIAPPGVAVLTYHSVSPDAAWLPWSREITVHPDTLDRHLATLRRMGCAIGDGSDWTRRRLSGEASPGDAVVLHFDDGYLDNHLYAAPLLRRYRAPATFFASLDFIAPAASDDGAGYMTWPQLAALDADPLFAVEPHGVGHARVPVSARIVDHVTPANWRRHAWLQWAATPGPKHDWFRLALPLAVPVGAGIPESGLALATPAWTGAGRESATALGTRIERDLTECRNAWITRLGRAPEVFCWPENQTCAQARTIATALGYIATTGGRRRNVDGEPPEIISRIHIGDRALGIRWLAAEALHLRAAVRLMQGNHYWYLLLAPMNLTRKLVLAVRIRVGRPAA